jgi:cholesterol transport system auxiliary component
MGYFGAVRASILDRLRVARCRRLFSIPLAGSLLSFLAACSSAQKLTYDLSPPASRFAPRAEHAQLAILLPNAILPESSDGIVVRTDTQSVAYLPGAQWSDRLPTLVQSRLIESFQNAHFLRGVGRPGMLADFSLGSTIRRFELDAAQSKATVEISAELTASNGRVVASRLFAASAPVPSSEPAVVAGALEAAFREVMREIVVWTAPKI